MDQNTGDQNECEQNEHDQNEYVPKEHGQIEYGQQVIDHNVIGDHLYKEPAYPPEELNPLALAYIGDAVYEIYIRQHVLSLANHRPHVLHQRSSSYASARSQSKALHALMPMLTEEEKNVVLRGRNAKSGTAPKNADMIEYRHSTAFECLIGYLYYRRQAERLAELMEQALIAIDRGGQNPGEE